MNSNLEQKPQNMPPPPGSRPKRIIINDEEGNEFPPDTAVLLTWSTLKFIRAPSSRFLGASVITVFCAAILVGVVSMFISINKTVQASGEVVTDFGTRYAVSPAVGQLGMFRKKVGDTVAENEVLATLMLDSESEGQINESIAFLEKLESELRTKQGDEVLAFVPPEVPNVRVFAGPALDAAILLEQQSRLFMDLKKRLSTGLAKELLPLRQRVVLLKDKIQKLKSSDQAELMALYLENSQDELGKVRAQIITAENDARLKLEQALGDYIKAVQGARGALENYLLQRQIRAPVGGVIAKFLEKENTSIEAYKPIAVIMPKDGKFIASIRLYSKDIVKISKDQNIIYKVEAYPYQEYGAFTGKVLSFEQAQDPGAPKKDLSTVAPDKVGDYLVYGTFEYPQALTPELVAKMRLVPGMKFSSEIIVDRKSISRMIYESVFKDLK